MPKLKDLTLVRNRYEEERLVENVLAHAHNILVHFAVALFVTGFVVDLIGRLIDHEKTRYAGGIMIVLGGVAGLATMATGEAAEENIEAVLSSGAEQSLEQHEEWGGWAGYLLFATALVRLSLFRFRNRVLSLSYLGIAVVSVAVLVVTAGYGGKVTHAGHPHASITSGQSIPLEMDENGENERDE